MKRTLVSYPSSEEDEVNKELVTKRHHMVSTDQPRRKLPRLSPTFVPPEPIQDPSKHQGRIRTTPHVDGQFASYVYVSVPLDREGSKLATLLTEAVGYMRTMFSEDTIRCDWLERDDSAKTYKVKTGAELHISLTRPIYLRSHQRDDLKKAVRDASFSQKPFTVSMANFATFENDERTRAFVSIEVGAGHSQLADLSNSLSNMLNSLRQKVFYAEPRFHASFAWALLRQPLPQPSPSGSGVRHIQTFPVIEALPTSLTSELSNKFGEAVASKICASEVGEIRAKIGKDVFHWNLGQSC